jgi:hypothetical protein
VALTELREGMVGSPLQSVIEVVTGGRGELGRHARVRGVSRDVHMDLAASTPELHFRFSFELEVLAMEKFVHLSLIYYV